MIENKVWQQKKYRYIFLSSDVISYSTFVLRTIPLHFWCHLRTYWTTYVISKSDQMRPQCTNSLLYIQTLDNSPIYFRAPPLDSCYDVTGKLALISLIHVALELHQPICFSAVVSLLGGYHTVSVYYHTISGTSLKFIVNK